MGATTEIQWTNATFNPWWGCAKISPGCDNCYAEEIARRFHPNCWGANGARRVFEEKHFREPLGWNRKAEAAGVPLKVFCGSMCDVFEKHEVADEYRPELFTLIHKTPWIIWQLLTKRVGNVARMVPPSWMNGHWPRNAWIGATVVNQEEADRDCPKLLQLPAAVRFLSCEPLLGPVDLRHLLRYKNPELNIDALCGWSTRGQLAMNPHECSIGVCTSQDLRRIDWVITGGESGPGARPMHPQWARDLRDQCAAAGVAFFFKQWGEWAPCVIEDNADGNGPCVYFDDDELQDRCIDRSRFSGHTFPDGQEMARAGKKASGRLLDGSEHNEFPFTPGPP